MARPKQGKSAAPTSAPHRLETLLERYSLSVIADKVGMPYTNVYMYIKKGRRIPEEFLAALVKKLGVNPAWLLTGEGAVYLADVTAGTASMADDVLALVQALNTISTQSLGTLLGKGQAMVLKRLDDALTAHDRIRTQLHERFLPVYKQLLENFSRVLRKEELQEAASLKNAIQQVARFCEDQALAETYQHLLAVYETIRGNSDIALAIRRETFARQLFSPHAMETKKTLVDAMNLVKVLMNDQRQRDARRLCRMTLAYYAEESPMPPEVHNLECLMALLDIDGDAVRRGMRRIQRIQSFSPLSPNGSEELAGALIRGYFFSGTLSFNALLTFRVDTQFLSAQIARIACWLEEPEALAQALSRATSPTIFFHLTETLLRLGKEGATAAIRHFEKALHDLTGSVGRMTNIEAALRESACHIARTQILVKGGKLDLARERLLVCEEHLRKIPDTHTIDLLWQATHCRNILRAIPVAVKEAKLAKLREYAKDFFCRHIKRGYLCFAGLDKE